MFETLDYGIREGEEVRVRHVGPAGGETDDWDRWEAAPVGLRGVVEEMRRGWTTLGERTRGGVAVVRADLEAHKIYVLDEADLEPLEDPGRVPAAEEVSAWRRRDREVEGRHPELCVDVVMTRDEGQRSEYEDLRDMATALIPRLEGRAKATVRTAERVRRPRFVARWLERRAQWYTQHTLATRRILARAEAALGAMAAAERAEAELAGEGRAAR